jgi:hypothetical protein
MNHAELIKNWITDLRGTNQNTYKFALQRAILLCGDNRHISINEIGDAFVKLYWNNVISFKLRETNNINQLPQIHKSIIETATELKLTSTSYSHAKEMYKNIEDIVLDSLPKNKAKILANPLSRLQHDYQCKSPSGDPKGKGWLYSWDIETGILINEKFHQALIELKTALNNLSVYSWAHFLEKYNHTPALIQKLEDLKGSRIIPAKVKSFLINNLQSKCFYCNNSINEKFDVDHFIPYAFLYDSPIWDLVISCVNCNRGTKGKFDRVPHESFVPLLASQNDFLYQVSGDQFKEFINFSGDSDFNARLKREYQACKNAGFEIWVK